MSKSKFKIGQVRLRSRKARLAPAHPLVAKTAAELAAAVWEEAVTKDNDLYRGMKESNPGCSPDELQRRFVAWLGPELLGDARAMLAQSIATLSDPALKDQIAEALIADAPLRHGRMGHRRLLTHH